MNYSEHVVNSWAEFETVVAPHLEKGPDGPYIFRGQSNSSWKLESSLARALKTIEITDESKALHLESKIFRHFREHAIIFHEDAKHFDRSDLLMWWELMQHYGAPTRLLDWAASPYVALYFAINENFDVDGCVYCMDMAHVNWIQSSRAGNSGFSNKQAFEEIRKSISEEQHEDSVIAVGSPLPTQRMAAQHSNLLAASKILIDYKEFVDDVVFSKVANREASHSVFKKIIINKDAKLKFLGSLYYMNISPKTLFPGLDGLGKSATEYLLLSKMWEH